MMKIISSLQDFTSYLVNKNNEDCEKILLVADGMCFNKDNMLSHLLQRATKIPSNVKHFHLSLNHVETIGNNLEEDLRLLHKLRLSQLQFQLDVSDFSWNSQTFCVNSFLKLCYEISNKFDPIKLKLQVDNVLNIQIDESISYIKFHLTQIISKDNMKSLIKGFTLLFQSFKDKIKQLELSFKITNNNNIEYNITIQEFFNSIAGMNIAEKQLIRLKLQAQENQFECKNILNHNSNLLQKAIYVSYFSSLPNILAASFNMSDSIKSLHIFQKQNSNKNLILSKVGRSFVMNMDSFSNQQPLNQDKIKSIIDSWNIYKLDALDFSINCDMLEVKITESLYNFISKQRAAKSLSLKFNISNNASMNNDKLNSILASISKLQMLNTLSITIKDQNRSFFFNQNLELTEKLIFSANLQNINISFPAYKQTINSFISLFTQTPNIQSIMIEQGMSSQFIILKNEELDINLSIRTNQQFEDIINSFHNNNFKIQKKLKLNLQLSGFEEVNSQSFHQKFDQFSLHFTEIKMKFSQATMIPFEIYFKEELKRDRNFTLIVKDDIIINKQGMKKINLKLNETFTNYLFVLNPKEVNQQNQILINSNNQLISALGVNGNNNQANSLFSNNNNNNNNNIQLSQFNNQQMQICSINQNNKKKKRKMKEDAQDKEIPKQFQSFVEMLKEICEYEECVLDFSNNKNKEFKSFLSQNFKNIHLPHNINFNLSSCDFQDCSKERQFFQNLSKGISTLNINCSKNKLNNQSCIDLFYSLQSQNKNLVHLDINLSETSIKKRGLLSLSLKFRKMQQLKVLRLNISQSLNANSLKIIALQKIFEFSSNEYLPNLEEFSLKASISNILLNEEFYNLLGKSILKLPKNLKNLYLNFKNNLYDSSCSMNLFLKSLTQLPEEIQSLNLNFYHYQNLSSDHIFSFLRIPYYIQKYEKLKILKVKTGQSAVNGVDKEKYAVQLQQFLKLININQLITLSIQMFDFNLYQKNGQLFCKNHFNLLRFLRDTTVEQRKSFIHNLAKFFTSTSPNIKISENSINQLFTNYL